MRTGPTQPTRSINVFGGKAPSGAGFDLEPCPLQSFITVLVVACRQAEEDIELRRDEELNERDRRWGSAQT